MGVGQVVRGSMLTRRCCNNEEVVEFKKSVFCDMLSIIPVLYTAVLSVVPPSWNSLSWEVSKHSGFQFCK